MYVPNILNMVYTLRFFSSSKCSLFHNSNVFGSCIIHISYTGCDKIKKKIVPAPKGSSMKLVGPKSRSGHFGEENLDCTFVCWYAYCHYCPVSPALSPTLSMYSPLTPN